MSTPLENRFSRRERQIMDILYRRGESSVNDVLSTLPDAPSYSAVRALLRILEEKGQVTHVEVGKRYLFRPAHQQEAVAKSTIEHVLDTFFAGNLESVVATLLSARNPPSDEELDRLEDLIRKARDKNSLNGGAER